MISTEEALQLLDLHPPILKNDLKVAYRKAIKDSHPDKFQDSRRKFEANVRTAQLNEAKSLLEGLPESDYPFCLKTSEAQSLGSSYDFPSRAGLTKQRSSAPPTSNRARPMSRADYTYPMYAEPAPESCPKNGIFDKGCMITILLVIGFVCVMACLSMAHMMLIVPGDHPLVGIGFVVLAFVGAAIAISKIRETFQW